jgi:hypothetical protein
MLWIFLGLAKSGGDGSFKGVPLMQLGVLCLILLLVGEIWWLLRDREKPIS